MKPRRFKKFQMIEVFWNDIVDNPNWQNKDESENADTAKVKTLGYYLGTKKNNMILAHSVTEDEESDSMVIPWSNIFELYTLGE